MIFLWTCMIQNATFCYDFVLYMSYDAKSTSWWFWNWESMDVLMKLYVLWVFDKKHDKSLIVDDLDVFICYELYFYVYKYVYDLNEVLENWRIEIHSLIVQKNGF
jgi:hypothetical protein